MKCIISSPHYPMMSQDQRERLTKRVLANFNSVGITVETTNLSGGNLIAQLSTSVQRIGNLTNKLVGAADEPTIEPTTVAVVTLDTHEDPAVAPTTAVIAFFNLQV